MREVPNATARAPRPTERRGTPSTSDRYVSSVFRPYEYGEDATAWAAQFDILWA